MTVKQAAAQVPIPTKTLRILKDRIVAIRGWPYQSHESAILQLPTTYLRRGCMCGLSAQWAGCMWTACPAEVLLDIKFSGHYDYYHHIYYRPS